MRKKMLAAIAAVSVLLVIALAVLAYLTAKRDAQPQETGPSTTQSPDNPESTVEKPGTETQGSTAPMEEGTQPPQTTVSTESAEEVEITFPDEEETEPLRTLPEEVPTGTTEEQDYETPEVDI